MSLFWRAAARQPGARYQRPDWLEESAIRAAGITDQAMIAFSGGERVPVLVDGDRTVTDSFRIAEYLEDTYSDRPSLFGSAAGRAHVRFVNAWAVRSDNQDECARQSG